ncbi:PDZ and LIM domain protein 4-like isoform X1 [Haliotis asinina]|uniref:PDZ and LIM domain protein 4-like isoform X1 n=1 Tax=Haliotis asinina TaxID=109174 RepID=UPI003531934D
MATTTVQIQRRSVQEPWGFRLQGGSDYRMALCIKKVEPGSPSQGHLTPGDIILAIGGRTSQGLTHAQAQNMIRGSGNALLLSLQRGGENFDHIKPKGPIKFAPWKHQQQH